MITYNDESTVSWRSLKHTNNAIVVVKAITRLYCMVEDGMIRRLNEKRGETCRLK